MWSGYSMFFSLRGCLKWTERNISRGNMHSANSFMNVNLTAVETEFEGDQLHEMPIFFKLETLMHNSPCEACLLTLDNAVLWCNQCWTITPLASSPFHFTTISLQPKMWHTDIKYCVYLLITSLVYLFTYLFFILHSSCGIDLCRSSVSQSKLGGISAQLIVNSPFTGKSTEQLCIQIESVPGGGSLSPRFSCWMI